MIERRKEPRVRVSLPVRVSGIDAEGERFTATVVVATSLSRSGALLTGLKTELRCGDMLALEYEGHKADFRIVWFLNHGQRRAAKVAVHKPGPQFCPWEKVLSADPALATNHGR
jgi:ribulose bisphosphate carboxylase small subunit